MKRWFLPAAARARGQSNDLNREILASNLFNCRKEVINPPPPPPPPPPVPSVSRCIHIVYRHKNIWEFQWSNFIYNCMSTFLHYVRCKDALLDCSAPGGERCESLTRVDEIITLMHTLTVYVHGHVQEYVWGQVSQVEISNCIPQCSVGRTHFSVPKIPTSGGKVLISVLIFSRYFITVIHPTCSS